MDESKRRDKLDDALLFVMGSVGILFGLIQLYVGSSTILVFVVPVALLGWVFPFYYGYIRGAMRDSMVDRYRAWAVLVVGLGFYAIIFGEEEVTFYLPDQRLAFVPALAIVPLLFAARKYLPRFRRFVLGPGFKKNTIVSEATFNIVFAGATISFAGTFLAVAKFLTIWDFAIMTPFAIVTANFVRKSNFFANRVDWSYKQVPRNGPLHGRRGPTLAYRVLLWLGIAVLIPAVVGSVLIDLGYRSDLLTMIVVSTLSWAVLLWLLAAPLRFLTRSGTRFDFTEPKEQSPQKES